MKPHSPGPWTLDVDITGWMFSDVNGWIVATIDDPDSYDAGAMPDNQTCEANARLIAAAPELLECLRWAVRRIETAGLGEGEYIERALDAIHKATGGQA